MNVHVTEVPWASHRERLRSIRRTVFIEEQNVPQDLEWDGADEDSRHFLAVTEAGVDIGCARLMPSGQIGRNSSLSVRWNIAFFSQQDLPRGPARSKS